MGSASLLLPQKTAAPTSHRHQGDDKKSPGGEGGEEEEEKEDKLRSLCCIIHSFAPLFCWNKLQRGRILSSPRPFGKKSLSNPERGPVPFPRSLPRLLHTL